MLHRIPEQAQKQSRLNPSNKIDYWVNFIDIDKTNEFLYVTSKTYESHNLLRHRITSHRSILHAEGIDINFSVKEDMNNLQFIFTNSIKESLVFLKDEIAISIELFDKAIKYLNTKKVTEEKSNEARIPSHTIQTSLSNSNRLFSNESLSKTPPTPSSDEKNFRI
jgi:hypothetical protein